MGTFDAKVAFVTGAGGGMGRTAAVRFAQEGALVFAADIREEALAETGEEILRAGGRVETCKMNIADPQSIKDAVEACIGRFGALQILVNFAGITQNKKFEAISVEEWDRMMEINLRGTFLTSQAAFRHMMENGGGSIVNISSAAVYSGGGHIGTAHYTASKAGVIGLSRAIAKEGAPYHVRCNVVCPGLTETGMTASFLETDRESSVKGIPLGRVGTPLDIVEAALFLSSEKAAYITGALLNVNGGLVMQ